MVSKRDDSNYSQVGGRIPTHLAIRFRTLCASLNINQSEGLEQAIEQWLEKLIQQAS